jgi:hypothetical protein
MRELYVPDMATARRRETILLFKDLDRHESYKHLRKNLMYKELIHELRRLKIDIKGGKFGS